MERIKEQQQKKIININLQYTNKQTEKGRNFKKKKKSIKNIIIKKDWKNSHIMRN